MLRRDRRPPGQVEWRVDRALRDPQASARVDLTDRTSEVSQRPRHARDPPHRLREHRQPVAQVAVADVDVNGVDREAVLRADRDGIGQLLLEDAELRRSLSGVQG